MVVFLVWNLSHFPEMKLCDVFSVGSAMVYDFLHAQPSWVWSFFFPLPLLVHAVALFFCLSRTFSFSDPP